MDISICTINRRRAAMARRESSADGARETQGRPRRVLSEATRFGGHPWVYSLLRGLPEEPMARLALLIGLPEAAGGDVEAG